MRKLARLSAMSPDEVAYRIREKYRREIDRVRLWSGLEKDEGVDLTTLLQGNQSSLLTWLKRGPTRRFYSSVSPDRLEKVRVFVQRTRPEWGRRAVEGAERLLEHEFSLLGYRHLQLGPVINWHQDPVTGFEWQRRYCSDFDLVAFSKADSKVIHELNRQQHLPRLAKAFLLTGDERYAREAVGQMQSWIDANPKWVGVNWNSSLEIALRSMSWMWAIFMLLPSESLNESVARRICKSLFSQLDQIYRFPSVYTSPNTHLIGEALALFLGGLVFEEYPRAVEWRKLGANILISEMQKQVHVDGVYAELSSYYHCYATDFYLQALILARRNNFVFPEWMFRRLAQMCEFVLHLTRGDGSIPFLGDDDGGRALSLASQDYRSFTDGLCTAAILCGRPDFKFQCREYSEESMWLLGDDSFSIYESLDSVPPQSTQGQFEKGGYFVQRSGWGADDSHLVFDCGNLGIPGGHGHADALSLVFFAGGKDLLVDSGTSVYNGAQQWREYFRSTHAHNSVVVDGRNQSQTCGTFGWKKKADSQILNHFSQSGITFVDGCHNGYADLRNPVSHRRRLVHIHPDYWIVMDELQGAGDHDYDMFYHFSTDAELFVLGDESKGEVECRARVANAQLQLSLYSTVPVITEATCGQLDPIQGWSSSRYGQHRPTPVLRVGMRALPPVAVMCFLTPRHAVPTRRLRLQSRSSIAATFRDGEFEDVAIFSMDACPLRLFDYDMRGEFFWIRTHNGVLTKLAAVNAYSFNNADTTIFSSIEPISHILVHFWEGGMVIERGGSRGKTYVRDLRDRQFQRK